MNQSYLHDLLAQLQDLVVLLLEDVIKFDDAILELLLLVCRSLFGRLQGDHLLSDGLHCVGSSFLSFGRHLGCWGGGGWLSCDGGDGELGSYRWVMVLMVIIDLEVPVKPNNRLNIIMVITSIFGVVRIIIFYVGIYLCLLIIVFEIIEGNLYWIHIK